MDEPSRSLKQKAYQGLREYLAISFYLWLIFGLFVSFSLIALVFLLPNPQRYPFRVRRARKAGRMP